MNELVRSNARTLRCKLDSRDVSAVDIARAHVDRVHALDPSLHAFLRLNPRVEDEARDADRRLADGDAGPLTGIPVAVKDNLVTAGLETTCGSRILDGFIPVRDATVVARLRRSGAVLLGKTNLDEFGMGSSTEHSAFGLTRNPWDPRRVPGGSSGGSAVAVAAGMAPIAIGSDTGGSIRQPAALCGVVGVKPTYGRVSRSGLAAFGSSLDQIGPMGRSVLDAAETLGVMAGVDPLDGTTADRPCDDWVASCERGVSELRIALPREYHGDGLAPQIAARIRQAAETLEQAGAFVTEVSLPHTRFAIPAYYLVATAEASSNLARYDGVRYCRRVGGDRDLRAMYDRTRGAGFGVEVRRRIMLGTFALSAGYHDRFYGRAQQARARVRRDFQDVFDSGIDLLLAPVTPSTAFPIGTKTDSPLEMYLSDVFTVPASLAGLPAISVPLGLDDDGLPIGGQLIAPHFAESCAFGAAAVLERAFPPATPDRSAGPEASA